MQKLDYDKKTLCKFGITMSIALAVIATAVLLKHKHNPNYLFGASILFLVLGLALPIVLKPVYIIWMRFAHILGWINTRFILIIMFYGIFTPAGLIMRLFGKDPLERKIEKSAGSYWIPKAGKPFDPGDYRRQF